jgi:hypothetical protein
MTHLTKQALAGFADVLRNLSVGNGTTIKPGDNK